MPTTSNFGWTTPADTDLVKDGALAIRTLGNGIDTSMAELKGGTTGQVLSKTSNTDMDFTWVTTDDANAIQNAIVDAKGDLIAATANDTPARLAVGNNGETIVADSAASTGLRYQTGVNANGIINGAFDIWQRGTSFAIPSSSYTYTADRWIGLRFSTGSTINRQSASLDGFEYSIRVQRDSGNTGTGIIYLGYNVETADSYKYAGKTVTLSFYAKAGANFSSASSALAVIWASGTGTNQKQMDGFTGSSLLANSSVTLTTSWQRFSFTAAVPSNSTQQGFQFNYTPVGTAGANDWFEITGVQLEFGSVATTFKRAGGGTIQGELAACQRYFEQINGTSGRNLISGGYVQTTSVARFTIPCVQKRTTPTVTTTGTINVMYSTGSEVGISSYTELDSNSSGNFMTFRVNTSSASLTAGNACALYNNTASTFAISAEL